MVKEDNMSELRIAAISTHTSLQFTYQREDNHEDQVVDARNPQLAHDDGDLIHEQTPSLASGLQSGGNEPEVLHPDHPLMKNFQAALKDHLQRQYNRLSEEIIELVSPITICIVFTRLLYLIIFIYHLTTHSDSSWC
jgi:hypothetical protein